MQTGLYIHIPFCQKKCPYCDFNTYAGLEHLHDDAVDAICRELETWQQCLRGRQISTVFLGGGTPTALSIAQLQRLFESIHRGYNLNERCEITCEVNPGEVDRAKFQILKSFGVNRLSLGVQSFDSNELAFLGRIHAVADVYSAYETARKVGFDNVNLDFMFGLPDQKRETWLGTLSSALELEPDHLSLYSLIVEPKTVLSHWIQTGQTSAPNEDTAAMQYECAIDMLAAAGYLHYEISNWARTAGKFSQHNLIYWRNYDYLGVGPGAHSHLRFRPKSDVLQCPDLLPDSQANDNLNGLDNDGSDAVQFPPQLYHMLTSGQGSRGNSPQRQFDPCIRVNGEFRWGNHKPVAGYVRRIHEGEPAGDFFEMPTRNTAMSESMMLGLRLIEEGVPFERFHALHNARLDQIYADELAELLDLGLIELNESGIRLSSRGLMIGNQVFLQFV